MRAYDFTQVDVFTERPLEGNQLAVFHSGRGLATARMQAIARETNLAETTFLFPGGSGADARVRIFRPNEELPFAGHPTLGTAFVIAQTRPALSVVRLRMKVGVIPVRVDRRRRPLYLEMRQRNPVFGEIFRDAARLADAIGLRPADLDRRYRPQVVSTGLPFLIIPLSRSTALARLDVGKNFWPALARLGGHLPYFLVTGEPAIEARMFDAVSEDPATGSAAGCAAAYLVACGRCAPDVTFVIQQGRFVARPSRIFAAASLRDGRVGNVRVGGHVVEVLKGTLRL